MSSSTILSFSLPAKFARLVRHRAGLNGDTLSEFMRDALEQKMKTEAWKEFRAEGARSAKKYQVSPEDIENIVDRFRD